MSELQHYYENFCSGWWAMDKEDECPCRGSGWAVSEVDTVHQCPKHFKGQLHPDAYDNDMSLEELQEAEKASQEEWASRRSKRPLSARTEAPVERPGPHDGPSNDELSSSDSPTTWGSDDDIPF